MTTDQERQADYDALVLLRCPLCRGGGKVYPWRSKQSSVPCWRCNGTGRVNAPMPKRTQEEVGK